MPSECLGGIPAESRATSPVGRAGQAERLACHWPPNAFCGLTPTPTFSARGPKGREKKGAFAQCRNYDAVDKEEAIFSLSLTPSTIPPLFGPVNRCVGQMGPGWHPCPCRLSFAAVSDLCGNVQIPLSPIPSGSYECSDNSSHNPWLSRKCSGMVCFSAAPYQNFYVRKEAETWRPEQETESSPFG